MAIAVGGRPEESAKMVWSCGCIAYLLANRAEGNAEFARPIADAYAASQLLLQHCAAICAISTLQTHHY
ncbi:hypothetical protein [Bradyrhizobium cenepequi]